MHLLLLAIFVIPLTLFGQSPICLQSPYKTGEWWQPSTYDTHGGLGTHLALDFNFIEPGTENDQWPFGNAIEDRGREIRAAHSGIVLLAEMTTGYGGLVILRSSENAEYDTWYGHLDNFASGLVPGTRVNAGDLLGYCGETGNIFGGAHLHFELRRNEQRQPITEIVIDGQPIVIDYTRTNSVGWWLGKPIQARSQCQAELRLSVKLAAWRGASVSLPVAVTIGQERRNHRLQGNNGIGQLNLYVAPNSVQTITVKPHGYLAQKQTVSVNQSLQNLQFFGADNQSGLIGGDVDDNNRIDDFDLASVIFAFDSNDPDGDINGDTKVDDFDLAAVIIGFGQVGD